MTTRPPQFQSQSQGQSQPLRVRAEAEAARLPPLLARAERLAGTVLLGEHGRRRAGTGSDFWQYRPIQPGDSRRLIDWRRSARGDSAFVREQEWQIAQTVTLWIDLSASMRFASAAGIAQKSDRAALLGLALSILLNHGGERVGLCGPDLPPRRGAQQLEKLAAHLVQDHAQEFGAPDTRALAAHSRAVFVSDFMGSFDDVKTALTRAADRNVHGVLVQVLDPAEETFPFRARTIFESPAGSIRHETLKAGALRARYQARLAERKDQLAQLARRVGWAYRSHRTDESAQSALLWLYMMISEMSQTHVSHTRSSATEAGR